MSQLAPDLRQSLRSLAASPLLTLAVLGSLVLGIGLNTALFTILDALFLRPVPALREPARVVTLFTRVASSPAFFPLSYRNVLDLRTSNRSCSELAAYQMFHGGLAISGPAEPINGEMVTAGYFAVVGRPLAAGRAFAATEESFGHAVPVAVISHALWRRQFGGSPMALGARLLLNATPFTIVGVAAERFVGVTPLVKIDVWVPAAMYQTVFPFPDLFVLRSTQAMRAFGRLRPGVTAAGAAAEFKLLGERLAREYPDDNRGQTIVTYPLGEGALPPSIRPVARKAAALLLTAVGLLLLMTCINIANLLLAKSLARGREMAIRLALGAPRRRLIQQLLVEGLLLGTGGGSASLLFAMWCRNLLWRYRPPILEESPLSLALDPTVLVFTLLLSLATGLLFGLLPALQATRPDLVAQLKGAATNAAARTRRATSTRELLLGVQLCFCTLTLASTLLFIRSLYNAEHFDPGFNIKDVVALSFDFKLEGYDEARGRSFEQRLLAKVRSLPFVQSAALAENRLLGGFRLWENVYPAGRSSSFREGGVYSGSTLVGPGYFATVGIPLLSGREFLASDDRQSAPVAIINRTMAARLYPRQNPIGRSLLIDGEKAPVQIVGIAMNSSYTTLGQNLLPFLYLSLVQRYSARVTLHAHLDGAAGDGAIERLRREVQALDPAMPLLEVRSIPAVVTGSLWVQTLSTLLLALFSVIALTLAVTGIYGLVAHLVTSRRRELGVRLALGAHQARVLRMVIRDGSTAGVVGTACGLLLAWIGKGALAGYLFPSRSPVLDLLLLPATALLLLAVVLLASLVPALRAARTDPAITLRNE